LKIDNKKIQARINEMKAEENLLLQDLEKTSAVNQEFSGFVRSNA